MAANSRPVPALAKLKPVPQQQLLQQQHALQHPLQRQQPLQHPLQQQQPQQQAPLVQKPASTQKPMSVGTGTSVFSRMRAAKPQKAHKTFQSSQNQLYVAAHTRQPAEQIYDLQRPLIV